MEKNKGIVRGVITIVCSVWGIIKFALFFIAVYVLPMTNMAVAVFAFFPATLSGHNDLNEYDFLKKSLFEEAYSVCSETSWLWIVAAIAVVLLAWNIIETVRKKGKRALNIVSIVMSSLFMICGIVFCISHIGITNFSQDMLDEIDAAYTDDSGEQLDSEQYDFYYSVADTE